VKLSARRPGDVGSIVAGNGRIKSELGWTPRHDDLRAILQQALDWERRLHNRQG
jgi:UDP-glucose 4-epimerase